MGEAEWEEESEDGEVYIVIVLTDQLYRVWMLDWFILA